MSGRTRIEAELKARLRDPAGVVARLEAAYGPGRVEVYRDTYYDDPAGALMRGDRELRVRTVEGDGGGRTVLTYKGARVDSVSGSKPEHETEVADAAAVHAVLRGLGYVPRLAFEKCCRNYALVVGGRELLATVVRVPELEGTFLEVETVVAGEDGLAAGLAAVRAMMAGLGVGEADLTTELYTDAVSKGR